MKDIPKRLKRMRALPGMIEREGQSGWMHLQNAVVGTLRNGTSYARATFGRTISV